MTNKKEKTYLVEVPSREHIIATVKKSAKPLKIKQLIEEMDLEQEQTRGFKNRLKAMLRDGNLNLTQKKFYYIPTDLPQITGRVTGHQNGYGEIECSEDGQKYSLTHQEMRKVMHGDLVRANIIHRHKNRHAESSITEVIERNTATIVCRLSQQNGTVFASPINPKQNHRIALTDFRNNVDINFSEDYALIDIKNQPTIHSLPTGEIIEVIKNQQKKSFYTELILKAFDLPHQWSDVQEEKAKTFQGIISDSHCQEAIKHGRSDLRFLPFCTIDDASAQDLDDAVYTKKTDKGWQLIVAIADVSHYVKPNDSLDVEAQKRGNSVYFPSLTVAMLPENLSNGVCSLNPKSNRFCLACEMEINPKGEIMHSRFFETIILTEDRLSYKKVDQMIDDPNDSEWQVYSPELRQSLSDLNELFSAQKTARQKRGGIDIEINDIAFKLSDQGIVQKITEVKRKKSHRLIEECMLMANVCAAKFLREHGKEFLYRVHDLPKSDKLSDLRELLNEMGIQNSLNENPTALDFSTILTGQKKKPHAYLIQTAILRTFKQAKYSPKNLGHFGLNYPEYTHFTSPIRRYSDLLIHRAIKSVLNDTKKDYLFSLDQLKRIGEHLSYTERKAETATREVINRLKCEYASQRIGDTFSGIISGVVSFGLFIELQHLYIEGLIHISGLEKSLYFDNIRHRLVSRSNKKQYALGDKVSVKIQSVSINDNRINLLLIT